MKRRLTKPVLGTKFPKKFPKSLIGSVDYLEFCCWAATMKHKKLYGVQWVLNSSVFSPFPISLFREL